MRLILRIFQLRSFAIGVGVLALLLVCGPQAIASKTRPTPRFCHVDSASAAFKASAIEQSSDHATMPRGVVLLANRIEVAPGSWVFSRLGNFSEEPAGYGFQFAIERKLASGAWEVDPASPRGPWPKVLKRLSPETAGSCFAFQVPQEQPPGQYRFSTHVQVPRGASEHSRRVAEFGIG